MRKRRHDLQLLQEDVRKIIKVSTDTITYWENNRSAPQIHFMPRIIEFLGYMPFSHADLSLGQKILKYRIEHGLSHKKLGEILNINASTVGGWERDEFVPKPNNLELLHKLFHKK